MIFIWTSQKENDYCIKYHWPGIRFVHVSTASKCVLAMCVCVCVCVQRVCLYSRYCVASRYVHA